MALVCLIAGGASASRQTSSPTTRYVAATGTDTGVCTTSAGACRTVQYAVDVAGDGDLIKVAAGTYTGVTSRAGAVQLVCLDKGVTICGGYTTTDGFTGPPDPAANPTILDSQGQGRVIHASGDVSATLEGLRVTGGLASGPGDWTENAGGGVWVVSATVTLRNCRITANSAGYGGGLAVRRGTLTLTASTVDGNDGTHVGGGMYIWDGVAALTAGTVVSNTAGLSGGGLHLWSSEATIERSVIAHNAANGDPAWAGGGGMFIDGESDVVLVSNAVVDNRTVANGGGLIIDGSSARLTHNTIARNGATGVVGGRGSGVHLDVGSAPCHVALTNTILSGHGTGVYAEGGTTVVLNGVLWHDDTIAHTGGDGAIAVTNAYTGDPAFAPDGVHLTVASAAIDGGVSAGGASDLDGDARPLDGDVNGSVAPDLGADEYVPCRARLNDGTDYATVQAAVDAGAQPTDVVKVAGHCAGVETRGGVTQTVYVSRTLTIRGGFPTYDLTGPADAAAHPTTLDAQGRGRVLYVTGDVSPIFEGLHVTGGDTGDAGGHWTNDAGGGIWVATATLTLENCAISGNVAGYGGGVALYHSDSVLTNSTIQFNAAAQVGGGLSLWNSDAALAGNAIVSNTAGSSGGGLHLWSSEATIERNLVARNAANGIGAWAGGGGVFIDGGSDAVLTNNAVVDNRAVVNGTGILVDGSSPRLLHTTVARNGATGAMGGGSGIDVGAGGVESHVALTNTILVDHGVGITVAAGSTATLAGVLWYDNVEADVGGSGALAVTDAITGDPAFAADGYHLTPGSPAIDRGVEAGVGVDLDGDARPIDGDRDGNLLPDLGADEARLRVYLPVVMRWW
jgi:hypothetical protein